MSFIQKFKKGFEKIKSSCVEKFEEIENWCVEKVHCVAKKLDKVFHHIQHAFSPNREEIAQVAGQAYENKNIRYIILPVTIPEDVDLAKHSEQWQTQQLPQLPLDFPADKILTQDEVSHYISCTVSPNREVSKIKKIARWFIESVVAAVIIPFLLSEPILLYSIFGTAVVWLIIDYYKNKTKKPMHWKFTLGWAT